MNLRRQLLLISLLTLVLPWAGCQFIRETESALREGQQQMLAGTAQAIADSLAQFPDEFAVQRRGAAPADSSGQVYGHPLASPPLVDGYFDDWALPESSLASLQDGQDTNARFAVGVYRQSVFLYADVRDDAVVYSMPADAGGATRVADSVELVSADGAPNVTGTGTATYSFAAEAPGKLVPKRHTAEGAADETRIAAHWQDTPTGFSLEARIPRQLLGARLGIVVTDADSRGSPEVRMASFSGDAPGRFVTPSPLLQSVAAGYVQADMRLIVSDLAGWRLAEAGGFSDSSNGDPPGLASSWVRRAYTALLESGDEALLAEPDPSGKEQQDYILEALNGNPATTWFRSPQSGRAVVAVAQPVWSGTVQTGAVILQQGTDAILSLRNTALSRLMNFTLIATLVVAAALLGYASWMSLRIRRLSSAAERALDDKRVQADLPSARAADEIGDLSRSFSSVLRQLGEYNEYLRTLASKLSHEMRTPLTIVTSSLENLEHEPLTEASAEYTARAKDGAGRLQKILSAMSEASRVEELIENAEPETFDLRRALSSTVAAYADAWPERRFSLEAADAAAPMHGSPELIIQMLDKLVDNAVGFSSASDEIVIRLAPAPGQLLLSVTNPGPPLPAKMRSQLFDSMVSVRENDGGRHLGLGLFIARLIALGHGGSIAAFDVERGVTFEIRLPASESRSTGDRV